MSSSKTIHPDVAMMHWLIQRSNECALDGHKEQARDYERQAMEADASIKADVSHVKGMILSYRAMYERCKDIEDAGWVFVVRCRLAHFEDRLRGLLGMDEDDVLIVGE